MADNATLKSQYLAQIQADLERTAEEKERIAGELAALQEKLTSLEQDHALLVGVQQALIASSTAPEQDEVPVTAGAPEAPQAVVPGPRKPEKAPRASGRATRRTRTAAGDSTGTNSAPAPTLVELVVADLTGRSEPRSAAEVATALSQAHPGRTIQTTVVRNTLEALVAKGQAQRSKQGRSVYYSAAGNPAPSASTAEAAA
ncbi:hypothetical protein [Streptomyces sp. NRRL F-5123]|uniref:hypothetical protein n=1 Tax=Streptomyces sp. NRRL F-5123 TaxID=1463856 RepID=UPI0004E17E1E|nr:hypothetical protein [Streptomyces sp. NRRL F-5123]